jgi:hypothetical protein
VADDGKGDWMSTPVGSSAEDVRLMAIFDVWHGAQEAAVANAAATSTAGGGAVAVAASAGDKLGCVKLDYAALAAALPPEYHAPASKVARRKPAKALSFSWGVVNSEYFDDGE